jgi:WD repeat-containing protein 1 (actin-interacting protein 1)
MTESAVESDGKVLEQPIVLHDQPNAMVTGSHLTVVVTVGGLILIQNGAAVLHVLPYNVVLLSRCVSLDDSTIYVGGEDCQIHVYNVSEAFRLDEVHIIKGAQPFKGLYTLALAHNVTKSASDLESGYSTGSEMGKR